ncbi:Peflin [Balamuthia mandrillaris]
MSGEAKATDFQGGLQPPYQGLQPPQQGYGGAYQQPPPQGGYPATAYQQAPPAYGGDIMYQQPPQQHGFHGPPPLVSHSAVIYDDSFYAARLRRRGLTQIIIGICFIALGIAISVALSLALPGWVYVLWGLPLAGTIILIVGIINLVRANRLRQSIM